MLENDILGDWAEVVLDTTDAVRVGRGGDPSLSLDIEAMLPEDNGE